MARHPGKSRCCSPAQPAELFARSGPRSRLIVLATNVATGGTGKCRRQALTDQVRSWELKGELDVEPEIEGVLGADPGIKGIFGGDLEIAGVLVGKYGRTAVGSGAFPLWQSSSRPRRPSQRNTSITTTFSHNVYYVQAAAGVAGTTLASALSPVAAWSLIVRDRNLTGPWAGFSFKAGRLVTPEGRELEPQDLAWLSLTAAQAQEWRRLMEDASSSEIRARDRRKPLAYKAAEIVDLRDAVRRRTEKRLARVMAGPDAEPPVAVLQVPGPKRRQRV